MAPRKQQADGEEAPSAEVPNVDVRGRLEVCLGGQDFMLRPSFDAIQEIERKLGSHQHLAERARVGALTIDEMSVIVAALMRAHGRRMKEGELGVLSYRKAEAERLAPMIYEAPAPRVCALLYVILLNAITGGYTAEGEAKAGTTSPVIPAAG